MPRKLEILIIYLSALLQGLVLISLPAASSVFTDTHYFGFTNSQYGALFIPQVLMSIIAAFWAPRLSWRWGSKKVYQVGILLNILAAGLLAIAQVFIKSPHQAYWILLLSTTAVGAAFGTTLPMINVYAQRLFSKNTAGALTALHTLLGIGTVIAPVLIIILIHGLGWWLMPLGSLFVLVIILGMSCCVPLASNEGPGQSQSKEVKFVFTKELSLLMVIVLLYGFCETIFSNWSIIYLSQDKAIPLPEASSALAIFWAMVTIGRLLASLLSAWIAPLWFYQILPIMMAFSLWMVTTVQSGQTGIIFFGLAGLSCSAFFPLTFSLGQGLNPAFAETVSGFLMAFYMSGYGLGSYGVGKIVTIKGVSLQGVYHLSVVVAFLIVAMVFILTRIKKVNQ